MYPLKQFLTNPAFLSQTGTPDPLAVSAKWLLRAATTHNKFKSELPSRASDSCFSILHNNVRSLSWNLENCQVHLLDELNFDFSIIGISESKIINGKKNLDFNPNLPGYIFEYAPTPLASGGVGLYIYESLRETVIEKKKNQIRLSRRYGLKSNPHKKVTSFAVLYIDSIILRNGFKNILTKLLKN